MSDLPTGAGSRPQTTDPHSPAGGDRGFDEPPRIIEVDDGNGPFGQTPEDREPGGGELAKQRGGEVAEDAREQAKKVGETARAGAAEVVDEAKHQAADLVADAREQLHGQARRQTDHLGDAVQAFGDKLHAMAGGRPEDAGQVADYADRLADQVDRIGGRVSELGFDGTVDELQRYARRRPGMFLLGAGFAGFVVARLGRGAKEAEEGHEPAEGQRSPSPAGPASGPTGDDPFSNDDRTHAPTPTPPDTPIVASVEASDAGAQGGRP